MLDPSLYSQVREIVLSARNKVSAAASCAMVEAYWNIGKSIVEKQGGEARAEYGTRLISELSAKMTIDFGKGFTVANLQNMRQLYQAFPDFCTLCRNKGEVSAEIQRTAPAKQPEDSIRDPYVLEFLGLEQPASFFEKDLEQALIDHLQKFLLESGRGFSFVSRQKRFTLEEIHFYIDIVFYNYILKCFVLVDLKLGDLTQQDLEQMQTCVDYYTHKMMNDGDNPPIGILLCSDKNDTIVRYILSENTTQIFASKYRLHLPAEYELRAELNKEYTVLDNKNITNTICK